MGVSSQMELGKGFSIRSQSIELTRRVSCEVALSRVDLFPLPHPLALEAEPNERIVRQVNLERGRFARWLP